LNFVSAISFTIKLIQFPTANCNDSCKNSSPISFPRFFTNTFHKANIEAFHPSLRRFLIVFFHIPEKASLGATNSNVDPITDCTIAYVNASDQDNH